MCIHFLNNYNKLDRLFVLLLFVFLINIVIALIEISIGWHLKVIPEFYLNTWVTRAPYTFYDNINDTAGYFMLFLPLTFIPLSKTKKKRFIFFVIFILTSIIIIKTSSRVNYIVLLIQFLFFINIFLKGIKTHTSKYLVGVFLIIAIIILAIQIINGNVGEAQSKLVEEVSSLRGIFTADSGSLFVRRELMVESINILLNSSLLGVGAGNIERYISDANISYLEGTSNLHNWWFELLSNYGIFIFIAFVIFYLKLLSSLRKLSKNNQTKKGKIYAGSVFISILSFSLVSLGSSSIIQIRYMWILFGITLATINSIKIELSEKESEGNIYEDTSYY
jgi:teichuronic acid biosynthesis protein TuaE